MERRSPRPVLSAPEAGRLNASRRRRGRVAEEAGQRLPDPSEQHPAAAHARRKQARLKPGTNFVNFPLHSRPFICYKQFTESRCVAEPDFVATLVRARHLSL